MKPHERITAAIIDARKAGRTALVPFMTAGYPQLDTFIETLAAIAACGDVVEVGVPFSDPMADGMTIQRSSLGAIANGVSLRWILDELTAARDRISAPLVLMSYLNPLLAFGLDGLGRAAAGAGVCGFIIPDLPYEESAEVRAALDDSNLALIQLVTPATPADRLRTLCDASRGFVYAVTVRGITGGGKSLPADTAGYLTAVSKAAGDKPVCAGFGIRTRGDVRQIGEHADGAIVGSALVEVLERGDDPQAFLQGLR